MRWVIARVLPVPAPARTHIGPTGLLATSRCSGSSAASTSSALGTWGAVRASAAASVMTRASLGRAADAAAAVPSRIQPSSGTDRPVGVVDHEPGDQAVVLDHGPAVVGPVRVLSRRVPVDPDELLDGLVVVGRGHRRQLDRALHHGVGPPGLVADDEAGAWVAAQVRHLGTAVDRRDPDDLAAVVLGVPRVRDHRELRATVPAEGGEDTVLARGEQAGDVVGDNWHTGITPWEELAPAGG